MKNKVTVRRESGRTVVIYSDAPKKVNHIADAGKMAPQKPVPVRYMGRIQYWIMPDGRKVPPRRPSLVKRIIRWVTVWSVLFVSGTMLPIHAYAA